MSFRPAWRGMATAWRLLAVMALALLGVIASAQQGGGTSFDHVATGYALTGAHQDVRCETCHVKGVFKGTPRDCATCHAQGNVRSATPMPATHIRTTYACDTCHTTSRFAGATYNHSQAPTASCASCHNNISAKGKPGNHVPTNASCDSCHMVTGFAPVIHFDHSAASFGTWTCAGCHDGRLAMGKPADHIPTPAGDRCETCHQASTTSGYVSFAGGQMVHTGIASGCAQCHADAVADGFLGVRIQSKGKLVPPHVPAGDNCESCHKVPTMPIPATGAASIGATTFAGGTFLHAGITRDCAACHGPSVAVGSFFGITPKSTLGLNPPHLPTSAPCETCHANAIPATAIPAAGAAAVGATTFANAQMSHSGITRDCALCHGPGVNGSSFFGVSAIVAMPPTSPPGPGAHIPSSTACENCHLASTPSGTMPLSAVRQPPGSGFATPAPTSAQIHNGVTGGCNACHDTNFSWMGMGAYPISPAVVTPGAQYRGFQTRPTATGGAFALADPAHPTTGDCAQCHSSTASFSAEALPDKHIPTAAGAACSACHKNADFRVMPTIAAIHANAPSTSANCAQCHSASAAAAFSNAAAGFTIVAPPANHLPTEAPCERCHVGAGSSIAATPVPNGARFANSAMNHAGITSACATCHGPGVTGATFAGVSSIVVMPPTSPVGPNAHIPSGTVCESCHLGSTPSGLIPGVATRSAPGTGFATPAPTSAQIHAGVTGGCNACHETGYSWMGMGAYPISPSTLVNGASYKGFQTRPRAAAGTFNVADAAHPSTGDCSQCHGNTTAFTGVDKPANHIPYAASAQCTSCHTASDYGVMPTITAIHANAPSTSSNCAQCHSAAAAASFAIPAANFSIVAPPSNHIPTSASCESCHVGAGSSIAATPVTDGARFTNSRMNHVGITSGCVSCHGPTVTGSSFVGVTRIVTMPPTAPMGPGAHIPSGTACETCHLGSVPGGLIPAVATAAVPGSGFATPAPTGAQIHSGVTGGCNACHDTGAVWMGVSAYPISPATKVAGAQYKGFQTRPRATAGTYNVADAAHPLTGDCAQCHGSTVAFSAIDKPANHIPFAATSQCSSCHTGSDYSVRPTIAAIHANAPSTTGNCAQCHSAAAAAGFAIPGANFSIVAPPANHIPTAGACETCHVGAGSSIAALPVGDGAKFANSAMNHAGITKDCVTCHGPGITGSSFAGIARIVAMPPTSPVGSSSHIPSSTTCETCHLGSVPAGMIPATATKTAPGTAFATPAPTSAQIHSGITGGCSSCHDTGYVWMGMGAYPISPTTLVAGAQYRGFQTRPKVTSGTYNVADAAHPSAGDCSQCHGSTTAFTGVDRPANHIPFAASAQCSSCHTSSDYGVMPTLAAIHANAPSTSSNCAQCHSAAAAASFAVPASNFSIVAPPSNHIPTSAPCESCHVGPGSSITATPVGNGAKFSGSLMNHAAISSGCASCHGQGIVPGSFAGVSNIVVMPPSAPPGAGAHIPTTAPCEACHLASKPSGLIPASATKAAPGTAFATPAPTGAQIHTGITAGCNSCHEAGMTWMGMSAYPISPTTLIAGASYKGFQTRPRATASTFSVADAGHPAGGDCSQCHSNTTAFTAVDKPANHIPYAAAAQCSACHTGTDYSAMPTIAAIHANLQSNSTNCAQCHATTVYDTPAMKIVGLPAKHVPLQGVTACETCHVGTGSSIAATPVPNGASFANSKYTHQGITSNCVTCHGPTITASSFTGISRIVAMPPVSPPGANAHIPSSTTCETCHLGSTPAGLIAANATKTAPGTAFATPVPTGAQIHAGVTSGCNACHDSGYVWMGMSAYPISPATLVAGASYRGFQTRPRAAGSTYSVPDAAHPAGGDCAQCHASTTAFTASDKPANHIPYAATAACSACHTGTDYSTMPTLANIHANLQSNSTNCAQCHATTAYNTPAMTIVGLPAKHVPLQGVTACEACHVGAGSSIAATPVPNGATFANSKYTHQGITTNCATCHGASITASSFTGINRIVVLPPVSPPGANAHIPTAAACEACHLGSTPAGQIAANATKTAPGTAFATPAPTGAQIHAGVTSGCTSCHEAGYVWMGMSAYPISPGVKTAGASYRGFQTRPRATAGTYNVADAAHPSAGDCAQCHANTTAFTALDKPANHIPYAATASCTACHTGTDFSAMPTIANIHANLQSNSTNCAQCHNTTAYDTPAMKIVGLPAKHVPLQGVTACETCHVGSGSSIAATPVPNGATFANSKYTHQGITTNCVTCHGASVTATSFTGINRIVVLPPVSPPGANAHIPTAAACEACHLGSTPAGLIGANATKTAPGSAFATPVPTGAQIHAGVTSGCNSCHEAGYVWMGMSVYPISPAVLTAGASYRGFQTRPRATASTFNVADPAHPAGGDCSQCHANTTAFTAVDKPANHIPYAAAAQCSACHTSADYSAMPTIANIHANLQSNSTNCAQCHNTTAYDTAVMKIVGLPAKHVPLQGVTACETCHVGSGSSIAATPVPNGATFANSKYTHQGITTNCVTCHGPTINGSSFTGIGSIVAMPPTSPPGANAHIPSSTTCETCHLGSTPAGLIAANATKTAPGTAFATPVPTGAQIHTGITSNCNACHDTGYVWMGMSAYPISPSVITAGASYKGFQTRPRATAGTFNIADAAHPSAGDCAQCHANTTAFTAVDKPANHIPYATTAACSACHTSSDYSAMPTIAAIHANLQSNSTNCAQCHATTAYDTPAMKIVGLPAKHVPLQGVTACEACHVGSGSSIAATPVPNGATFANSKYSHQGITTNCVTCHGASVTSSSFTGINTIVVLPPVSPPGAGSHIPSSAPCEACHLGSTPAGLIGANATKTAPGTAFATPAPTGTQIHAGISGNCNSCHEAGYVWMGMSAYPISPGVKTAGASYKGFQTRPRAAAGTYNVADAAHPSAGDCSQCHANTTAFTAVDKPANHIPYAAAAQCSACHTGTDYSAMPTIANIHANLQSNSTNCAQCHNTTAYDTPAMKIVGLPAKHVPLQGVTACEACHVGTGSSIAATPVPNGATFANSKYTHQGITTNCVTCHGASITASSFTGISRIVVLPPVSPPGAGSHIPSAAPCEACHLGSTPAGLIGAIATKTAPGTAFATPVPTGAQIHAGITSNCNACHDTGYVWMGMSQYPISPTTVVAGAQYKGFQTRPRATTSTFSVADAGHPASGDCSQCHTSTVFFDAAAMPTGHIPTSKACTQCHIVSGDYSVAGLTTNMTTLHTGITTGCRTCHTAGTGAGPFAGCTTKATCASPPPITYQPKVMPLAAGGSPTTPSTSTHVPVGTAACEACHKSVTSFAAMNMKSNATAHAAVVAQDCKSCHEGGYKWFGVTIRTKGLHDTRRSLIQDCNDSGCHSSTKFSGFEGMIRVHPVIRSPLNLANPRMQPGIVAGDIQTAESPRFDHRGVLPGQCMTCHNGRMAKGLPVKHIDNKGSCDTCHRVTSWLPAQFNHQGVLPGQCFSCHNGTAASGKPGSHFVTSRSCDSCHRSIAWLPASYTHMSIAYKPAPDKPTCVSCHQTNGEIVPRQMHSNHRNRPVPVPVPGR